MSTPLDAEQLEDLFDDILWAQTRFGTWRLGIIEELELRGLGSCASAVSHLILPRRDIGWPKKIALQTAK